ncbi:hypothetical protein [Chelativorans sp. J32]|uniref:hypothetical protein n=1 Tax=Chelativorans sp. J32 TaxID=935840 RepID=UPI0004B17CF4|nr:hypothetical protein [Chelativorans sp. J32]
MATTTNQADRTQPAQTTSGTASSLGDTASTIGSDMKQEARNRVEEARGATSESLRAFAEAVRHAGDELKDKDEGPASQLLSQAASGLEQISNAIGQKRLDDLVGDVRRFGREHPGAFMLGSVLVGVALGRFARSAAPTTSHETAMDQQDSLEPLPDRRSPMPGGSDVF